MDKEICASENGGMDPSEVESRGSSSDHLPDRALPADARG